MLALTLALLGPAPTPGPIDFARAELKRNLGRNAARVELRVIPGKPESYTIRPTGNRIVITGGDAAGAMYGAFEFEERLRRTPKAWTQGKAAAPYLHDRGLNLFLTLPWDYKRNDTDPDAAALVDPNRWWFQNDDYWRTLLDLMAHSRLNWLDIHGAWDISVTDAPNLYAYFIQSPKYPLVGVDPQIKTTNLARLNNVIAMAHERGIRVSLMSYQAGLNIPQNPRPPYPNTEAAIYDYTRDVVEQMIRQAPGLDAIGFRIGESGKGESFFNCYSEAIKRSGREIPLVTRSWITTKQRVLPLARASKDFTVEIKFNGEQWGGPYPITGGRTANWYSYAFEDYFSDSGPRSLNARTWPGKATEERNRWPGQPYKIVWQVRANGTNRIFPFYNPEWVRRTITSMKLGTVNGYTVEGLDAYFPKSPDYYLANPKERPANWIHERDSLYWMTWGRLGYDPKTPDSVFDAAAARKLGPKSNDLVKAWKLASPLIEKALMAYCIGPDHRNHAPELEWGGDTDAFLHGESQDTSVFQPLAEYLANRATGGILLRPPPLAALASYHADDILSKRGFNLHPAGKAALAVTKAALSLVELGDYYSARLNAAYFGAAQDPESAKTADSWAEAALKYLAGDNYYKPFTDRLRMHTNNFTWADELRKFEAAIKPTKGGEGLPIIERRPIPAKLTWSTVGNLIRASLVAPKAKSAYLLEKPLPSSTFYHQIPMRREGGKFVATFPREPWGHTIYASIPDKSWPQVVPDPMRATPYLVIPAETRPTPQIYNASEALTYLDPQTLNPAKYPAFLIGTRAANFFGFPRAQKRKLLEPVSKGARLVILQQNFSARYPLDWLPKPLNVENAQQNTFNPEGALRLNPVSQPGILWQRFTESPGWHIYGNGGLASMPYGKGEIWVTTARLIQNMEHADAAQDFVKLLSLGGKTKPTVLMDSCSENAVYASACHPDLMNSHQIPFLTLGEVIAKEQGMSSFTPIPGPAADDDLLNGQGEAIANRYLRNKVIRLSSRPTPPTKAAFEAIREARRTELRRTLGLDPMPPKTPLNARITGTIQQKGYRIEKLVFESRPRFYVTAHLYIPDQPTIQKLPAILNVNGHWAHKKDEDRVQLRCAFEALRGYVAMAIDSPGHSFEGNALFERAAEGDHNDYKLLLGGTNATGYYVWDAIRALDYLETRPEVDMNRLGITGASGGGLATLYAFAADDRFKAAVPVVYMSSLESANENGCLCNHVPGTCQIGDRSDVIAIQAPKLVLLMGAEQDGEFPPDAMRRTQAKMAETWKLFGKQADAQVRIFPGGHDYGRPMREAMLGFFDRALLGKGDGKPVPEPEIAVIDPQSRTLLAADPPIPNERTMRELSIEALKQAQPERTAQEIIAVNGGVPEHGDLKLQQIGDRITFESEPGLTTPGLLVQGSGPIKTLRIVLSDAGKAAAKAADVAQPRGTATLYLDVLGTGELAKFEMRYAVYAGTAPTFTGGWQIVRAAEALGYPTKQVELVAEGPISCQAALYAGLLAHGRRAFKGYWLKNFKSSWEQFYGDAIPAAAIQPRANLCGSFPSFFKEATGMLLFLPKRERPDKSAKDGH
jgi:dienelactone hydrolase